MIRHIHYYAVAPGRQSEAERALIKWTTQMEKANGFSGAEVLREDDHMKGVVAVVQDWDSDEAVGAFLAANKAANPTLPDVAGPTPRDQGGVLFAGHGRADEHGHDHGDSPHGHDHASPADLSKLDFNRGGGLFARLVHGHFDVIAHAKP